VQVGKCAGVPQAVWGKSSKGVCGAGVAVQVWEVGRWVAVQGAGKVCGVWQVQGCVCVGVGAGG